jgi:hypothetical protein
MKNFRAKEVDADSDAAAVQVTICMEHCFKRERNQFAVARLQSHTKLPAGLLGRHGDSFCKPSLVARIITGRHGSSCRGQDSRSSACSSCHTEGTAGHLSAAPCCPDILQGLEKYLLTKLYDRTFGVYRADQERDEVIDRRLQVRCANIQQS